MKFLKLLQIHLDQVGLLQVMGKLEINVEEA